MQVYLVLYETVYVCMCVCAKHYVLVRVSGANVVRWEMRTRPFLRSTEFLWQEGHTAHVCMHACVCMYVCMYGCEYVYVCMSVWQATAEDAIATAVEALDMYADVCKVGDTEGCLHACMYVCV